MYVITLDHVLATREISGPLYIIEIEVYMCTWHADWDGTGHHGAQLAPAESHVIYKPFNYQDGRHDL